MAKVTEKARKTERGKDRAWSLGGQREREREKKKR